MEFVVLLRDLGVFALASWAIQNYLSKSADRKFEFYKSELDLKTREFQATLDSKMEFYRAELNLQNYKSTKVYERQLDVIVEVNKKLSVLDMKMQELVAFLKPVGRDWEKEQLQAAADAYNDFLTHYQNHLVFMPIEIVKKVDFVKDGYRNSFYNYELGLRMGNDKFGNEKIREAASTVQEKIPPALEQLAISFRELIGVERPT